MDTPDESRPAVGRVRAMLSWSPDCSRRLLDLFVLTGFAIVQPLLDVTGRAPEFFVFRRAGRADVVLFLLIVTLVPALALWLLEQLARLVGERAQRGVHLVFELLLITAIAIQVGKKLFADRGYSLLLAGLLAGAGLVVVLVRSATARTFLRYLTPAPLVFALLFVFAAPAGQLITTGDARSHAATGRAQGAPLPPVVMIIFDEFPTNSLLNARGGIDAEVFPNFARLARASTWFREASGVSGYTTDAIPAMLTGRYPKKKRAAIHRVYPDNLFTLLADDYVIHAKESISELCPRNECAANTPAGRATGLAPVLREAVGTTKQLLTPLKSNTPAPEDQFAELAAQAAGRDQNVAHNFKFKEARAANNPKRFSDFVASLEPSADPTMYFLHILLPHYTYRYLPSGATYAYPRPDASDQTPSKPGNMPGGAELTMRQRYMLQLAYTDKLLGQVIDKLEQNGLWERSLVVVTADHGRGFNRGPALAVSRRLGGDNEHELAYVPTFIKVPLQKAGAIDDRNWEHVDLLPTIADALDYDLPWDVEGVSGLGTPTRTRDERWWFNTPGKRETFSAAAERPQLLAGVIDLLAEPASGKDRLFHWGPHGDLVGRKVSDLDVGPPAGSTAAINTGPRVTFDPSSGTVPAMVWGTTPGASAGTPIAIAINGTIGAVAVVSDDQRHPLTAMVHEGLFRRGRNTVELFVVEPSGGQRLLPMTVTRLG